MGDIIIVIPSSVIAFVLYYFVIGSAYISALIAVRSFSDRGRWLIKHRMFSDANNALSCVFWFVVLSLAWPVAIYVTTKNFVRVNTRRILNAISK